MGYRTYIGYLPKEKYQEIKDLPKTELLSKFGEDEDGYVGPYEIGKELYEFGKYTNFNPQMDLWFHFSQIENFKNFIQKIMNYGWSIKIS